MAKHRAPECVLAERALAQALSRTGAAVDERGYCEAVTDNLVAAVTPDLWNRAQSDLAGGKGSELDWKFRAAYSSAALVVNTFMPMADGVSLPGTGTIRGTLRLEVERSAGTRGFKPTLDVVLDGADAELMIESKCREYLAAREADFSVAFVRHAAGFLSDPAARVFGDLYAGCRSFDPVDAPQLLKDFLAAARRARRGHKPVILVYAYWEPVDAGDYAIFAAHRERAHELFEPLSGNGVELMTCSYRELWAYWERSGVAHVDQLRARYDVALDPTAVPQVESPTVTDWTDA